MSVEFKEYIFKSFTITVKTPFEELLDHIKKEEIDGWKLFAIQSIIETPFTYFVTMYRK